MVATSWLNAIVNFIQYKVLTFSFPMYCCLAFYLCVETNFPNMKFTQDQALESLKRELTNNGRKPLRMSEKTLNKVTEALLPKFADDETGLPDFITAALEILNPVNDNIGKDKSDFIKSWKADHPDPTDPEPTTDPQSQPGNSELAALKAEIEALKKQNENAEKQRKLTAKKSDLSAKLKEKGVDDKEWLDNLLSEVNITEELDVDAKADSLLKLYNKSKANVHSAPTPGNPGGTNTDNIPASLKKAKELAERERKAAQVSQTTID